MAADQSNDIDELDRCVGGLARFEDGGEKVDPFIRDLDDRDIGLCPPAPFCDELLAGAGEDLEDGCLADLRQTYDAGFHVSQKRVWNVSEGGVLLSGLTAGHGTGPDRFGHWSAPGSVSISSA